MTHPDEGTLQAFLDDELSPAERAELAEHLLECEACQASHQELLHANALFSRAISLTDVEPPAGAARPLAVRARSGTSAFVKAAILILALAATAAATVPGSPVRTWIVEAVNRDRTPEPVVVEAPAPEPEAETPAPAPSPAGVFLPVTEPVVVSVSGSDGTVIRLLAPTGQRVGVSVAGADRDPSFRTRPGRIEVRGGVGGELLVSVPAVGTARLEVGGRLYAEAVDGAVRLHVAADTVGSSLVWQ